MTRRHPSRGRSPSRRSPRSSSYCPFSGPWRWACTCPTGRRPPRTRRPRTFPRSSRGGRRRPAGGPTWPSCARRRRGRRSPTAGWTAAPGWRSCPSGGPWSWSSGSTGAASDMKDEVTAADSSSRAPLLVLLLAALAWLVAAGLLGLVASIQLHSPRFLSDCPVLTYGRMAALAETAFVYGWLANAGLGLALRLLGGPRGGLAPGPGLARGGPRARPPPGGGLGSGGRCLLEPGGRCGAGRRRHGGCHRLRAPRPARVRAHDPPLFVLGDRGHGHPVLVRADAAGPLRIAVVRGGGPLHVPLDPVDRARDALLGPRARGGPGGGGGLVRAVRLDPLAGAARPLGGLLRRSPGDGQGAALLRVRVARILVPRVRRGPDGRPPPAGGPGARVDRVGRGGLGRAAPLPRPHRVPQPARLLLRGRDRPKVHRVRDRRVRRGRLGRCGHLVPRRGRPDAVHVL